MFSVVPVVDGLKVQQQIEILLDEYDTNRKQLMNGYRSTLSRRFNFGGEQGLKTLQMLYTCSRGMKLLSQEVAQIRARGPTLHDFYYLDRKLYELLHYLESLDLSTGFHKNYIRFRFQLMGVLNKNISRNAKAMAIYIRYHFALFRDKFDPAFVEELEELLTDMAEDRCKADVNALLYYWKKISKLLSQAEGEEEEDDDVALSEDEDKSEKSEQEESDKLAQQESLKKLETNEEKVSISSTDGDGTDNEQKPAKRYVNVPCAQPSTFYNPDAEDPNLVSSTCSLSEQGSSESRTPRTDEALTSMSPEEESFDNDDDDHEDEEESDDDEMEGFDSDFYFSEEEDELAYERMLSRIGVKPESFYSYDDFDIVGETPSDESSSASDEYM